MDTLRSMDEIAKVRVCNKTAKMLRGWGVVGFVNGRNVWPGDGSLRALFELRPPESWRNLGLGEILKRYRRIRRIACARDCPHPEWVLDMLEPDFERGMTKARLTQLVGQCMCHDTWDRLTDRRGHGTLSRPVVAPGAMSELWNFVPEALRPDLERRLGMAVSHANPGPLASHIGSVIAFSSNELRIFGALMLIQLTIEERTHSHRASMMSVLRSVNDILPAGLAGDRDEVTLAWERYEAGETRPFDGKRPRLERYSRFCGQHKKIKGLILELAANHADELNALLPALRRYPAQARRRNRMERIEVKGAFDKRRKDERMSGVLNFEPVLVGAHNRFAETGTIVGDLWRFIDTDGEQELQQDASGRGFTSVVPVLGPDGSLTPRTTKLAFRVVTPEELWAALGERFPEEINYRRPVGWGERATRPPSSRAGKSLVIFDGEASRGDYRPFWLEACALGTFERQGGVPDLASERSKAWLAECDLSMPCRVPNHLLAHEKERRNLAKHARKLGWVPVPIEEIHHAFLFASLVVNYGIRFGARIGEIMQFRIGPDCFGKTFRDGRWQPVVRLKPKGWNENADFGINRTIRDLVTQCRHYSNARWYPGLVDAAGNPDLPITKFGVQMRDDIPDARFILATPDGALRHSDLSLILRVLLKDVIPLRSHTSRYIFKTLMSLDGVPSDASAELMHHAYGSPVTHDYDLSGLVNKAEFSKAYNAGIDRALSAQTF